MYPARASWSRSTPRPVGRLLEGEFRPGFFGGVLTVVHEAASEINRARDRRVRGEGRARSWPVSQMVADLDLGVVIACRADTTAIRKAWPLPAATCKLVGLGASGRPGSAARALAAATGGRQRRPPRQALAGGRTFLLDCPRERGDLAR